MNLFKRSMVGDPGFEPGSKRPKRPSIGQANPIAPCSPRHGVLPMKFTQGVASNLYQAGGGDLVIRTWQ